MKKVKKNKMNKRRKYKKKKENKSQVHENLHRSFKKNAEYN